jgi:hypothetical protein
LKPHDGRQKDIHFASLNLLERAGMQFHQLSQFLLSEPESISFSPDIRSESPKLRTFFRV